MNLSSNHLLFQSVLTVTVTWFHLMQFLGLYVISFGWLGGVIVSVSDLRSRGHGFNSWPFRYSSNNSGQVVHTHVPLSPSSIIWYQSKRWEGNGSTWERCGPPQYHPHNWAVSAAHCRLRAVKWTWAPTLRLQSCERVMLTMGNLPLCHLP